VAEFRKDPILRQWVIVGTERAFQPSDLASSAERETTEPCPFCEGREAETLPEIAAIRTPGTLANTPGWQVRVVPHKYAVLRIEGSTATTGGGLFEGMGGVGAHEVIVESPHHTDHPGVMSVAQLASVIWMYRERYRDLDRDERFKYLLLYRNHGRAAAALLPHPHSQLIALPIIPKRAIEELQGARQYFVREGRCVYCDIVRQEEADRARVVCENDAFIAFAPFAAWCPFELWILPKAHVASFGDLDDAQMRPLAAILREVLGRLHAGLADPPYHYVIHTSPYDNNVGHFYHWHIEVIPRLSKVTGFEWGSGFYINAVPPEDAAQYLREVTLPPSEEPT